MIILNKLSKSHLLEVFGLIGGAIALLQEIPSSPHL